MEDILFNKKKNYQYLYRGLDMADTVITTNWDLITEKVLYELMKWYPSDGYGFSCQLKNKYKDKNRKNIIKIYKENKSSVKVLKLHGSIGWHLNDGKFYLDKFNFLRYFGLSKGIFDVNCPHIGRPENPVMLYPSYLKQLNNLQLQQIWSQAAAALNKAKQVTFVGYSLPEADMGVRVLLNPLRVRLNMKKVEVNVVLGPKPTNNTDLNARNNLIERWRSFLGDKIKFHDKSAANYFLNT